jgi:hypothetical protein
MLVIVNSNGVPSVMPFLNLDSASANKESRAKRSAVHSVK